MINQVTLVGRLTKDPELRTTMDGIPVTQVTLAVNRHFKNQDGQIEADFVQCTLWRKTAENTSRYCQKGSVIGITGRIQSRHYDNNDGRRVYVTEVVAESVQFLGKKVSANAPVAVPQPQQRQASGSGLTNAVDAAVVPPQQETAVQTPTATLSQQQTGNFPASSAQQPPVGIAESTSQLQNAVNTADSHSHQDSTSSNALPPQQEAVVATASAPQREAAEISASQPQREAFRLTTNQASSGQASAVSISAAMSVSEAGNGAEKDSTELPF